MDFQDALLQLSPRAYGALLAGACAGSAAGFYFLFRWLNHLRLVADTPTSAIRSAAKGYVELEGLARLMEGEPIIAPLSGQRCVWYRYRVEEKSDKDWRTVEKASSDAIFHLDDGTGTCIVDPDGARVLPIHKQTWRGESRRPGRPPGERDWLDWLLASGRYRYTEERIRDGEPLYVLGQFEALGGADPAMPQDEIRDLLARWKRDPASLRHRFDLDGDGDIGLEEWERVREAAERQVLASWHERRTEEALPLLRKPRDGRPFVLSALPQQSLLWRIRSRILLAALAFFGLGLLAITAWNVRSGP